jgi:hypothetical protein
MKNGQDKKYIVKKSFMIGDQVLLMEGDELEYVSMNNDNGVAEIYFIVTNSFWSDDMELCLNPAQVAEHLIYKTIYR